MQWNQEIFNRNIEYLIAAKCGGVQNRFNDILGRDSATRWKKSRPSIENLLAITEEFDCSLDWLLTGKETRENCVLPPGHDEFYAMLKEILTQSSDEQVKKALRTNLVAFKNSVEKDAKKAGQDKRIKKLESEYTDLKNKMHYLEELYDRKIKSDT